MRFFLEGLLALSIVSVGCGSDDDSSNVPDAGADASGSGGSAGSGGSGGGAAGGAGGAGGSGAAGGVGGAAGTGGAAGASGSGGADAGPVVVPCDAASNVLKNPSFELVTAGKPDSWFLQTGSGATIDATVETFSVDGSSVLRLTTPNPSPASRLSYLATFGGEAVPVPVGNVVSGHFYAKLTDWGLNGYYPAVSVEFLDSTDNVVSSSKATTVPFVAGEMVQYDIVPSVVPAGTVSARVRFVLRFDTTVYFDAMCLRSDATDD